MNSEPYIPVNCGFHDRLLDFATRSETVSVVLQDDASTHFEARILDVYSDSGAEFIAFDNGCRYRLDELESVAGFLPDGGSCMLP
ncbi:MAG: hypothetical protein RLZZ519_1898 [Bacteroidota bacterium]|jgi:hypothetical protein